MGVASYWPTPAAELADPRMAAKMNTLPKLVVSRTLDRVDWANTRIVRDDLPPSSPGSGRAASH